MKTFLIFSLLIAHAFFAVAQDAKQNIKTNNIKNTVIVSDTVNKAPANINEEKLKALSPLRRTSTNNSPLDKQENQMMSPVDKDKKTPSEIRNKNN